ncbi:MAG: SH3 domain-containing protein, partial [Chloroflexi bacterium]|nr:SH3 domain-containing protein [Chloroflexota bacterium]
NFLVENAPANLPVATDALIASLVTPTPITATVAVTTPVALTATIPVTTPVAIAATPTPSIILATATPAITATPTVTTSNLILVPTMTPTPVATASTIKPTAITNANLRSGPGTEFPILGGTTTGEELTIVARNADNSWLKLNNGGWISTRLVNNPPAAATIPVEQVTPGGAAE